MKNIFKIAGTILIILLIHTCKSEMTPSIPIVNTASVVEIFQTTATVEGAVTNDGGAPLISRGICWNKTEVVTTLNNKTIERGGLGTFTSIIDEQLIENTKYYVRAYATNSVGTGYGDVISFITKFSPKVFNPDLTYETVTDIEGNQYKTITISKSKTIASGTQVWMAENLITTKYNDGTNIPLKIIDNQTWLNLNTPGYCWYNNDEALYKDLYGALYNWYTVNTGKLCPLGWHVPTDADWHQLILFFDPDAKPDIVESLIVGGKLKESGTTHWEDPNIGATNEIGFTALPGGNRGLLGSFNSMGFSCSWWSSTVIDSSHAFNRFVTFNENYILRFNSAKVNGFYVRCIKDN